MAVGLRLVTERVGAGAGVPVLDSGNGEELIHVQPGVSIILANRPPDSPGTLYVSSKQVVWLSDVDRAKGYAVDFLSVSLHAVSRDPEAYPSPCIYTQIDTDTEDGDESESSDSENNETLDLSKITEMRLVPSDPNQLDMLFEIFCKCAEMNPEPVEEEEEGRHNWIFSADQMAGEGSDGEEPDWHFFQDPTNSIGHSNGGHDLAHSVLELQINDERFEDAKEMEGDDDIGQPDAEDKRTMAYAAMKPTKPGFEESQEPIHKIRITLSSKNVKNLEKGTDIFTDLVNSCISVVRGARLTAPQIAEARAQRLNVGTNTWDRFELRVHKRVIDLFSSPEVVKQITSITIEPGVEVEIGFDSQSCAVEKTGRKLAVFSVQRSVLFLFFGSPPTPSSHNPTVNWGGPECQKRVQNSAQAHFQLGSSGHRLTVLVTGAAGFVGTHVSMALKRRGDGVVGLDNFNRYYDPTLKLARQKLLHTTQAPSLLRAMSMILISSTNCKGCLAALDTAEKSTGSSEKKGNAQFRVYNLGNTSPVPVSILERLLKAKAR
ncbi:nucleotide-sensitive chloride conductance regulator (ICln) family protein [Actinidia rufa]|uniref:Nucleotide-sensitive chloride conductance regulator (ICln) family protein n=1 Tax=Actinidia rufa TaxID=165716 RepID=A0A7J0GXE4_9ERIC|nr:nucleotide-sensitive chloride conductance regulator (ICln) family protein [Actinidia rufa]